MLIDTSNSNILPTQPDGPGHGAYGVPRAALPDCGQVAGAGAGHLQQVHRAVRPGHVRPHLHLEHRIIVIITNLWGRDKQALLSEKHTRKS